MRRSASIDSPPLILIIFVSHSGKRERERERERVRRIMMEHGGGPGSIVHWNDLPSRPRKKKYKRTCRISTGGQIMVLTIPCIFCFNSFFSPLARIVVGGRGHIPVSSSDYIPLVVTSTPPSRPALDPAWRFRRRRRAASTWHGPDFMSIQKNDFAIWVSTAFSFT